MVCLWAEMELRSINVKISSDIAIMTKQPLVNKGLIKWKKSTTVKPLKKEHQIEGTE